MRSSSGLPSRTRRCQCAGSSFKPAPPAAFDAIAKVGGQAHACLAGSQHSQVHSPLKTQVAHLAPKQNKRKLLCFLCPNVHSRKLMYWKKGSGSGLGWRRRNGDRDRGRETDSPPDVGLFLGCPMRGPGPQPPSHPGWLRRHGFRLRGAAGATCSGNLVVLKRSLKSQEENPCFLYLRCDPNGGEEVVSIGILSSARNMEVYSGEEYCGTSRGRNICTVLDNSEHEKIVLYKKYLKLESSTLACKIKMLSFGEKPCVFISKIVVHMKLASANSSAGSPVLGSRIDLDRVQTMMESMGSKLSPGAQQLMNMVRFQQRNSIPFGEQLESVLGRTGYKHMLGLQSSASGALDKSSCTPLFKSGLISGKMTEDLKVYIDKNTQPPDGGNITNLDEHKIMPQNHAFLENDLKNSGSSFLPKKGNCNSNIPKSELLPFLQNLCSQVNHLRVGHNTEWQENIIKPGEGIVGVAVEELPVYSYLEKILSKNMELMEKKLTDYIDQRIYKLQEHIDNKIALLMNLLQNPNSPPTGMPLRHCDSGEKLSNGER